MMRLDLYLSTYGYVKSRQRAKSLIEGGHVKVDSQKITKPSYLIDEEKNVHIEIIDPCPYVSRGGLKLEKAILESGISINNVVAIDIGASTGGFTDCLLKHGARLVYAIDSGTNQLDESLKNDSRVVSIENYNARALCYEDIGEYCDIVTIDVSFISQTYILPSISNLLKENGNCISLIKPQFEVGRSNIGKGGIVKDKRARLHGVMKVIECASALGLNCLYFFKSPILGGDGNVEFLTVFSKHKVTPIDKEKIQKTVLED